MTSEGRQADPKTRRVQKHESKQTFKSKTTNEEKKKRPAEAPAGDGRNYSSGSMEHVRLLLAIIYLPRDRSH